MLYLFAICGVALCGAADALLVLAARGVLPALCATGAFVGFGSGGMFFLSMSARAGGAYAGPLAIWSLVGALAAVATALVLGERQTRTEWVGLVLVVAGVAVRAVGSGR